MANTRKILSCFQQRGNKNQNKTKLFFQKNGREFYASLQGLVPGETVVPESTLLGFYQSLSDPGDGKYPSPGHFTHRVPSKRRKNLRSTGEVHSPGQCSPKDRGLIVGTKNAFQSLAPHHRVTKSLFTAVPFTYCSMLTFQQKLQGTLKGKKGSLNRLNKHQNQIQIWQQRRSFQTRNLKILTNMLRAVM